VSPEERTLVRALYVVPGGRQPLPDADFLRGFGAADGMALGLDLLRDAVDRRDLLDVELALVVCFRFGFCDAHLELLVMLAWADWHQRHEDVASALAELRSPASVDALVHLAEWVPGYLEFDDARALAVKAIWALGGIGGEAAHKALESLASSPTGIVAESAVAQLEK
jgi:HEAT repeat protein